MLSWVNCYRFIHTHTLSLFHSLNPSLFLRLYLFLSLTMFLSLSLAHSLTLPQSRNNLDVCTGKTSTTCDRLLKKSLEQYKFNLVDKDSNSMRMCAWHSIVWLEDIDSKFRHERSRKMSSISAVFAG